MLTQERLQQLQRRRRDNEIGKVDVEKRAYLDDYASDHLQKKNGKVEDRHIDATAQRLEAALAFFDPSTRQGSGAAGT